MTALTRKGRSAAVEVVKGIAANEKIDLLDWERTALHYVAEVCEDIQRREEWVQDNLRGLAWGDGDLVGAIERLLKAYPPTAFVEDVRDAFESWAKATGRL